MKRLESFDSFTQKQKVYYLKSAMCRKIYDTTDILSLIMSILYLITKIETYYLCIWILYHGFQAKIRRRRQKSNDNRGGNVSSAYTDDEGFGSCNDQSHNGPESLNLSLNGNLTAPNTTVTTPITPVATTGRKVYLRLNFFNFNKIKQKQFDTNFSNMSILF